jgi:hypothetical protein
MADPTDATSTPNTARPRCPGCGHSCCPHPSLDCGGESDAVRACRHCVSTPTPAAAAPYGFGLLRSAAPDSDLTPVDGGLDSTIEMVTIPVVGSTETEHAECPECLNDGPHLIVPDDQLECGSCYGLFDNPFC